MTDKIALIDAMLRRGGNFERRLAEALRESTDGHYFAKALVDVWSAGDDVNRQRLLAEFPVLWAAIYMPEADRVQHLLEAFPDVFAKFEAKAAR